MQIILLIPIRVFFRGISRKTIYNSILVIGIEDEKDWLFEKAPITKFPSEEVKRYFIVADLGIKLVDVMQKYTKVFISIEH